MSLLYIFAATPTEAKPVRQIGVVSSTSSTLRCGPNELILMIGGMGPTSSKQNAERALQFSSATGNGHKPDAVLIIGLCGGLSQSLSGGRIVIYTKCLSTDTKKSPLTCSQTITDSAVALLDTSNIKSDRVVGITSRRIAITPIEKGQLAQSGAEVVDMESYAILDAADRAGIPAAVMRVVSDTVDFELPDFNRALNDAGVFDGRKALQVALGAPIRTIKLLGANRRAIGNLTKALEIILMADCFNNLKRMDARSSM
jgi:nucleoside phosphorylase